MNNIPLFEHQKESIEFLKKRKGAILALEMGLGKSRCAIMALGTISDHLTVIICPASLKINWEREIHMVYPEDEVYVGGDPEGFDYKRHAWLVINYDQLKKWIAILDGKKYSLVGDEAHYIKGSSKRSKLFLMLANKAKRVYLLTGTPVLNRPIDLYNLLKAIKHPLSLTKTTKKDNWFGYAMKFCGAFRRRLGNTGRSFLDVRGATNLDILKNEISDSFLRKMKSEVLDLPEKLIQIIPIEISDEYRKKYDSAFDDYIKFLREHPIDGKNLDNIMLARHIVELQKLKQVCSEAKIAVITEDVRSAVESEEKVIIFTQYSETLRKYFFEFGDIGVVRLSGETGMEERQRAVDEFQNNNQVNVFVGNIKAAGIGITLTAATNVFFADLDWTPAIHDQAADRAHRIGQTGTVNVRYYVVKDTIEEDILKMLDKKRSIINQILSGEEINKNEGVADMVNQLAKSYAHLRFAK